MVRHDWHQSRMEKHKIFRFSLVVKMSISLMQVTVSIYIDLNWAFYIFCASKEQVRSWKQKNKVNAWRRSHSTLWVSFWSCQYCTSITPSITFTLLFWWKWKCFSKAFFRYRFVWKPLDLLYFPVFFLLPFLNKKASVRHQVICRSWNIFTLHKSTVVGICFCILIHQLLP